MPQTTGPLAPGDVLGDRYALRVAAWSSALGPVWEARDQVLNRMVFIQVLADHLRASPDVLRAFQRNAAAIAQVQHTAILRVFDIGEDPPFIVFEHADGGRLMDRIARGGMRAHEAVRGALTLARGLEALHAAGLTHGSLSPTSVLRDTEGRLRLMAVGAAATTATIDGVDARDEQPEGYRPPEGGTGPEADRFALAALTYHMITGRPPGRGGARRIALPGGLVTLLQRALSDDPAARPSLDQFVAGLAPFSRPDVPKARRPRAIASEFRWLTPVIVIVVIAVLAVTIGVSLVQQLAETDPTPSPSASPTVTADTPLTVASVTDFDPHGSDGQENPERTANVLDDDLETDWRTLNYASIDLDKPGVGLLVDLGDVSPLARVVLKTSLPGWEGQIRIGDELGDTEEDFAEVGTFTAEADTTIDLPAGTAGRYVLVWITRLVEHNSSGEYPHRAEIAELAFFGV